MSKSDVFSIGLIILQIGLHRDLSELYDSKNGYLNKNLLNNYYEDFRLMYLDSKFLITLINKLIEFDPLL
jgi:hypothetical protein